MGIMKIVVNILLFLTLYGTEGRISLTSDHEVPNYPCQGDRVVYTCSTSDGVLSWDIRGIRYRYVRSINSVNNPPMTKPELPGVKTVLTAKDGDVLISTLTIPSAGGVVVNGSIISCADFHGHVNRSVLRIIGSPSAPGISATLRDFASGSVNVQLTPPVYGRECLSEYIVEYDDSSRTIGTSTSTVISNLDLCFQEHNFSAFGVTPGVPNGTRSSLVNFGHVPNPVMVRVVPSQDLCPNRNPNTVSLTWNQPTQFRECISGYTLETTTARETQSRSVTSNTASVSVGCCLRYNFTVTPFYTRSPTGQRTTRNISLSFVSGQSDYPDPGNLQLTVMYGNTIALTVHWQNANGLRAFQNYMIVTCVDNNPHEKVTQRGTLTAPTNAKFLALDYMTYIDRSVPVSVTFSRDDCTGSSSRSVTFPSIISGEPTVELEGENATFTVTFATIPSVTFNVVSTAIVEVNVTARQEDADLIRETIAFPPDFPRVTTTQILITNLTQGTEYRYTVRVLTTSNYFTAVVIPSVVRGTFPMTTQADIGRAIGISLSPVLAVLLVIIMMVMAFLFWKKVSNRRQPR